MTKGISNFLLYSDHNYLQSLKKLTGVRLPPDIQTMEEALFYHVSQVGDLNLPLDEDNLIVVYESINPVLAFVNSAVTGKLNTKMFNLLDSISTLWFWRIQALCHQIIFLRILLVQSLGNMLRLIRTLLYSQ